LKNWPVLPSLGRTTIYFKEKSGSPETIHIDARLLVVPELVVEGRLGAALLGHMKLKGGQLLLEIFFGVFFGLFITSMRILLLWPGAGCGRL